MVRAFHDRERHGEAGFTLVELLVAMTLSLIVLFALLQTFDAFSTSAARQTRVTDASDQVRATVDGVVRELRQAQTIEVAGPNDLVYTVTDSAAHTARVRLCLDAATSRLWRSSVTTINPPAVPIAAGTACPTAGSGAYQVGRVLRSSNSTTNPIFRYDSGLPAKVRNVSITLALDAGNAGHADTSTLRTSAFVRARAETAPAVTRNDIDTSCRSTHEPVLTLAAGVGAGTTVSYTDLDNNSLGDAIAAGTPHQLPAGASTVVATVTSALGAITQIVESLGC
jgi:prepilin-type N-terminal cleavage/methylation domain-containing protein